VIPIIKPDVRYDEVEEDLRAILATGVLTSGPYLQRFEEAVAEYVGAAHGIATTSATTALHLVLAGLGVGPGDEVLVSDFTFPATGNVIVQLGATPVLVDSSSESFGMDPDIAGSLVTERTRAIVPVDPFGQPCDLSSLAALAQRHDLALVEDAACALGASSAGRRCGAWPNAGCFSFHPRKVITTGEGGMVTTNDDALADRLRRLRSHGGVRANVGMSFVDHGFNYRLSEIQCALGVAQMARIDEILADRAATADRYATALARVDGITVPRPADGDVWSYQSLVVVLADGIDRDRIVGGLREAGIETTLGTYAMHAHPAFARFGYTPGALPRSWALQQQSLTLPLLPAMEPATIELVVAGLSAGVGA
jgi:dTDP-4-amino-4,6-dideoxygalactose transaminase